MKNLTHDGTAWSMLIFGGYALIMGLVLLFAFFLVVANTLVDIGYAWLDPRIRFD